MIFQNPCHLPEGQRPAADEIASLALKFYLDSNCQEGHDRENWLCAEYMLTQKHFIRCQIEGLHDREANQETWFSA
jgi:hypothetical protein